MKKFNQIGARDLKIIDCVQVQIEEIKDCCPYCNYGPLDGVSKTEFSNDDAFPPSKSTSGPLPKDGCPSICFNCSELLIYRVSNNKISIDKPSEAELLNWKSNYQMWDTLVKIQKIVKESQTTKKRF